MSDAICRTLGLGTSASERAACRLLEANGSEPAMYISAAEAPRLRDIIQSAPADLRPKISNALLNGLNRPGGAAGRVSAAPVGVEQMLQAAAQPTPAPGAAPNSEMGELFRYGMQRNEDAFRAKTTGTAMAIGGGTVAAASVAGAAAITAGVITAPVWVPIALAGTAIVGTGVALWGVAKMFTW